MSPVVQAALIAGGVSLVSLAGTVVVAVSGFRNTRRVSGETIAAAADNAHSDRLWAAQAAAYVDVIANVQWQQVRRQHELTAMAAGDPPLPADKPPVDWKELTGRLFAYASPAVLDALKAASDAGLEARARYRDWQGAVAPADVLAAALAIKPAVQAANDKDDALVELIRAGLHRKPSQALSPPAPQTEPWSGLMGPPDPA